MKRLSYLPRRARWAVPAAVLAAAGALVAGPMLASAASAPELPARSAGELVAALTAPAQASPLSGTIVATVSLGLPALQDGILGSPASAAGLLAGSHTAFVWYSGPQHYRLALQQSMGETDLVRDGASAWLWNSAADTATRLMLPPAGPLAVPPVLTTPQQAASQALKAIGPTTTIRVDSNVTVAGQAAYQLVLAPNSPGSLIGQVRIAVDSRRHLPLRVQVFAKGAAAPAVQIGFTAISFTRPPASEYAFTPPAGAMIVRRHIGAVGAVPVTRASGSVRVIGTGWRTVVGLPLASLASLTGAALTGSPEHSGLIPFRFSSSASAPGSAGPGIHRHQGASAAGAGDPLFGALMNAAKPVSGPWGSGRLVRTSLASILITGNGRVLIGAVTPGTLYRAAMRPGRAISDRWQHTASQAGTK